MGRLVGACFVIIRWPRLLGMAFRDYGNSAAQVIVRGMAKYRNMLYYSTGIKCASDPPVLKMRGFGPIWFKELPCAERIPWLPMFP